MNKKGKITQIIGAVVDVNFENDLPEIFTALEANNSGNKLYLRLPNILEKMMLEQLLWMQQRD